MLLTVLKNPFCSCVTGQPDVFRRTSGRIVILTSYMTSLVLMAAYSAYLISSLVVEHQHLPFRDLQGLLSDGSYKLGVLGNSNLLNINYVCEINYLWLDYLEVVGLGLWTKLVKYENMPINRVLLGNYFQRDWRFEIIEIKKIILQNIITSLANLRTFSQRVHRNNRRHVQWY
jgi:hypothetical protein